MKDRKTTVRRWCRILKGAYEGILMPDGTKIWNHPGKFGKRLRKRKERRSAKIEALDATRR